MAATPAQAGPLAQLRAMMENSPRQLALRNAIGAKRAKPNYASAMPVQMVASTDLTNAVKNGSPTTYQVGDWFVKKWAANQQLRSAAMNGLWNAAYSAEVPVPNYKQERLTDTNEYVFSIKKCVGSSFFQHSKPGHETALKTWLRTGGHDAYMLERYKRIFQAAKMGDPQAFYEDSKNGRIEFMDIQQMGGGQMGAYADYIDTLPK
jgi:hypothetical protein